MADQSSGITGYGAYIPRLRLSRAAMAAANVWLAPQLIVKAKGSRAMANWDEDSLTMGVAAARDLLGRGEDRSHIGGLAFASTTLPFADRQNAAVIASALTLERNLPSLDISSSMRAGTGALLDALGHVHGGRRAGQGLVIASDHRHTRAVSAQELDYGDGAAALTTGSEGIIARFLGSYSLATDFVDHFRGSGEAFDYHWEERWIRDEGYARLVPEAVAGALKDAGVEGSEIKHFILPCLFARVGARLAKACGIPDSAVRDTLAGEVGETGAAHSLLMLVHALQEAKPGDKILVAQFAAGCDALIFEVTEEMEAYRSSPEAPKGVLGHLGQGREETNYMKFLVFNRLIEWEKGMRAEQDKKTALTTLYRNRDMLLGLVGGRCRETGTVQFPMSRISVNPNNPAVDTQEPYKFAERKASVLSWSADYLAFSVNPPAHYGMMVFEGGGRIMLDITDVSPGEVESGMEVEMVFRIKDFDERRGFTRYFWKAVPASRGGKG